MLTFFIIILTLALVVDCLLLGLLILVQLPKKDAGVGMAFGGGAADALFGAGSGNALTKLTKYTAAFFFVLVVLLSIAKSHDFNSPANKLIQETERIKRDGGLKPAANPEIAPTAVPGTNTAAGSNAFQLEVNPTNTPRPAVNIVTNASATNPPTGSPK